MVKAEYLRFVETLNKTSVSEDVRRVANLILTHFDELLPLSTYQGQRVKRFVAIAQSEWNAISLERNTEPQNTPKKTINAIRLKSLSVGPFRGFSRQEIFDLNSRLVLIYGPNGTGKSSFCEALEYGLLGSVAEAESKRFRDQQDYLKNAYTNQLSMPTLSAVDDHGDEFTVTPDNASYRFCFVEKNRIDNFSRIAAQAPAKQTELISTLFGLDQFNEFIRNFTEEIDPKYIDLTGVKSLLLNQKQQELLGSKELIKANNLELQKVSTEETLFASKYFADVTFDEMLLKKNVVEETSKKIQELETELKKPAKERSALSLFDLEALKIKIEDNFNKLTEKQQVLSAAGKDISFKQLYEAVSQLEESSPDKCPACKTPITEVAVNPYSQAGEELERLKQLAEIQQEMQQLSQISNQLLLGLNQILNICLKYLPQGNLLQTFQLKDEIQPTELWWNSLHQNFADQSTPWWHLVSQVKQLEAADKSAEQFQKALDAKVDNLSKLRQFLQELTALQAKRETLTSAINLAQKSIDNFDAANIKLITEVEAEKESVAINKAISTGYKDFVDLLSKYSNSLPSLLLANLGEMVVTLYNSFNRNDSASELLEKVKLPLAQNQRLQISFQSAPLKFYDALHILSEGHIRCLGLAILLAKNYNENCPMLIFDDPVNAIDDDHKESIRKTLFEESHFSHKQIILTCHGEEFLKDICNLLPAKTASQSKTFSFLSRLDETHIRIDFNSPPRNYILAARENFNRGQIRDALSKSRQALESLTKGKVWKYVSKYGDGNLSLKLRAYNAPIELRNITDQLTIKIKSNDFLDSKKDLIYNPLSSLLGIDGNSREWRYLNKGTHEETDRAEFDRATVDSIIFALESLDSVLS